MLLAVGSTRIARRLGKHSSLEIGSLSTMLAFLLIRVLGWLEQTSKRVVLAVAIDLWEGTLNFVFFFFHDWLGYIESQSRRLAEEIPKAVLDRVTRLQFTPWDDGFDA
jgi:hypothetical protein